VLVFFLINTSSLGLYQDKASSNNRQGPITTIFGKIGDNGWYVTTVIITFKYDPKLVMEIQYYLDDSWHVYTGPIQITKDGIYNIGWFWKDFDNHIYYELPIIFKINQTPPTIKLTKRSGGQNKMIFNAATTDEVSKVECVEFYLDDVLQQTVNNSPYKYTWIGEEKHMVYAIG